MISNGSGRRLRSRLGFGSVLHYRILNAVGMSRSLVLAMAAVAALGFTEAKAADPGASFVTKLFIDACVPNMGQPAKVQAWAEAHQLQKIQNQTALDMFVGPGSEGEAWAVRAREGDFALSIRGKTHGCAVWAQVANPSEAEANFKQIVEGVRRPGLDVKVEQDTTSATPAGQAHVLAYRVSPTGSLAGFVLLLLTAERPSNAFQVSMEIAGPDSR